MAVKETKRKGRKGKVKRESQKFRPRIIAATLRRRFRKQFRPVPVVMLHGGDLPEGKVGYVAGAHGDNSIHMAGTLMMLAKRNKLINDVWATGHHGVNDKFAKTKKKKSSLREHETLKANKILGLDKNTHFLRMPFYEIGRITARDIDRIERRFNGLMRVHGWIDFMLIPSKFDYQKTNVTTNIIMKQVINNLVVKYRRPIEVWVYETHYSPLRTFNTFVEIPQKDHLARFKAIEEHKSQMERINIAIGEHTDVASKTVIAQEIVEPNGKKSLPEFGGIKKKVENVEAFLRYKVVPPTFFGRAKWILIR